MACDLVNVAPDCAKLNVGLIERGNFVIREYGVLFYVFCQNVECATVGRHFALLRGGMDVLGDMGWQFEF